MAQDRRQADSRDQWVEGDMDEEWREMDEKKRIQRSHRKTLREMKQDILIEDFEFMSKLQGKPVEYMEDDKPVEANAEEIALKALHVDDDPTLNPWTFRVFILGRLASGLSSLLIPSNHVSSNTKFLT